MAKFFILLAVLAIGFLLWFKLSKTKGEDRKKLRTKIIIGSIIATLVLLAATGRLNAIYAAIAGAIALLPKFAHLLRYLPLVNRMFQQAKNPNGGHANNQQQTAQRNSGMTQEKAFAVLGLKPDANKEDIISAHKKMMQKVHPDRGGSDYLAAEINQAKDTLLG